MSRPPPRVLATSSFVDTLSLLEDLLLTAVVPIVGRHKADRTVQMLGVVPADEAVDPALRLGERDERARGILGPVFIPESRDSVLVEVNPRPGETSRGATRPLGTSTVDRREKRRVPGSLFSLSEIGAEAVRVDARAPAWLDGR